VSLLNSATNLGCALLNAMASPIGRAILGSTALGHGDLFGLLIALGPPPATAAPAIAFLLVGPS